MRLETHVLYALDDLSAGRPDSALMHACIAIDPTARKLFPRVEKVGNRYRRCLREYYWVLEPMIGAGMNLVETRFENVPLPGNPAPDFAEIIYTVFRCRDTHGEEIPLRYSVTKSEDKLSHWAITNGELHMPDRIVVALLAVSVFSAVNRGLRAGGAHWLGLGHEKFLVKDWWGREAEFRRIAAPYNQTRVTLKGLNMPPIGPKGPRVQKLIIRQPYMDSPDAKR